MYALGSMYTSSFEVGTVKPRLFEIRLTPTRCCTCSQQSCRSSLVCLFLLAGVLSLLLVVGCQCRLFGRCCCVGNDPRHLAYLIQQRAAPWAGTMSGPTTRDIDIDTKDHNISNKCTLKQRKTCEHLQKRSRQSRRKTIPDN